MRTHWRTVLGVSLAVAVVVTIVDTVVQGLTLDNIQVINDENVTLEEAGGAVSASLLSGLVTQLTLWIGTVLATAMLTIVMSRAVLGRPVTLADAWRDARPQVLRMFGLAGLLLLILLGVFTLGLLPGFLTLSADATTAGASLLALGAGASAVVTVWLWVRFGLASPALMLERQGVIMALRRSTRLVRGAWWRVFGILLLAMLIVALVQGLVSMPFLVIGMAVDGDGFSGFITGNVNYGWPFLIVTGIGTVIALTVTLPISAGVAALLYMDQRIRREALDVELARAAGITGYGAPADRIPGS
jgi:hypothetical protein